MTISDETSVTRLTVPSAKTFAADQATAVGADRRRARSVDGVGGRVTRYVPAQVPTVDRYTASDGHHRRGSRARADNRAAARRASVCNRCDTSCHNADPSLMTRPSFTRTCAAVSRAPYIPGPLSTAPTPREGISRMGIRTRPLGTVGGTALTLVAATVTVVLTASPRRGRDDHVHPGRRHLRAERHGLDQLRHVDPARRRQLAGPAQRSCASRSPA